MKSSDVGRDCGWFSQYRYEKTVEGLKLQDKLSQIDPLSLNATTIKNQLNSWECQLARFKLDGDTLYCPSLSAIEKWKGIKGISNIKLEILDKEENWDEVLYIDHSSVFDIINHHHWNDKPNKHLRSTKLHQCVQAEQGSNIPNSLCRSFIMCCKVCKITYKPRNVKDPSSSNPQNCWEYP